MIIHFYVNQGNACKYRIICYPIYYNGCLLTVCMCGRSEDGGGKGGGGRGGGREGEVGVGRVGVGMQGWGWAVGRTREGLTASTLR